MTNTRTILLAVAFSALALAGAFCLESMSPVARIAPGVLTVAPAGPAPGPEMGGVRTRAEPVQRRALTHPIGTRPVPASKLPGRVERAVRRLAASLDPEVHERTTWDLEARAVARALGAGSIATLERLACGGSQAATELVAAAELLRLLDPGAGTRRAPELCEPALARLRVLFSDPAAHPELAWIAGRILAARGDAADLRNLVVILARPPDAELEELTRGALQAGRAADVATELAHLLQTCPGEAIASRALRVLATLPGEGLGPEACELVARTLEEILAGADTTRELELRAVTTLVNLDGPHARRLVREAFDRGDTNTRVAVRGLAMEDLAARVLDRERSPESRLLLAEELGRRDGLSEEARHAVREILHTATASDQAAHRRRAVLALAELEDAGAAAEVVRLARSDPDPSVRATAALALGRHASTGSDALRSIGATDESPGVRRLARHALEARLNRSE